jgi:hypothetical protein
MAGSYNPLGKKKYWNQFNGPLETNNEKEFFDAQKTFSIMGLVR